MGRQKYNKREHIEKTNILFEGKYLRDKGLLHEQNTTGVVWHRYRAYSNCNTPGGHATFVMPGGPGTGTSWAQKVDDFYQTIGSPSPGTWIGGTGANSPSAGHQCWQYEGIFPQGQLMGFNDPSTISTYPDCTACENQVSTSGDWWCDPTGQYVGPTGSPCLQSPTQPQSYFTGPSTTEQDCIAQCGTTGAQEYVCMGGVVGPGGTNSCTGPHPAGTYQMGAPNVMGIYPTQNDCDAACVSNTGASCDFSWTSPCATQHFGSLGGVTQSQSWLASREAGYNNVGCQHLQNVVNWLTNQLNSGVTGNGTPFSQLQITRKTAKRNWAICQGTECGCTLNVPTLTGTGNQTTEDSHENFTGTVCNCVGDCSSPTSQVGAGFQAASATHQCNGQMCTDTGGPNGTGDIGQIFDYDDGSKTLTFTLNSFSNPGIFGVSQTPGINMPSATCPVTPANDPDLIDPEAPTKKDIPLPPPRKKPEKVDVKSLNEERERMKQMWKHKL